MNKSNTISDNLENLGYLNSRLSIELRNLPELKNYETDNLDLVFRNILSIYQFAPKRFDLIFNNMNTIGLKGSRNYCSPLQALFWLIHDEKIEILGKLMGLNIMQTTDADGNCKPRLSSKPNDAMNTIHSNEEESSYTLEKLLDAAWDVEPTLLTSSTIHKIIQGINSNVEVEEYSILVNRHSDLQLQGYLMNDFLIKKEIFDINDWSKLEAAVKYSRWKSFYTVANRLNAPELISYYINKYFFFQKTPSHGVYLTFFRKRAQCTDAAYFAQYMLKRAGYKTFMRSVKWDDDPWDGMHTGAGILLDDGSYLLVANFTGINSIGGPFTDIESLDQKMACGKKIIGSKWGAYYPPRYY